MATYTYREHGTNARFTTSEPASCSPNGNDCTLLAVAPDPAPKPAPDPAPAPAPAPKPDAK